MRHTEAIVVSTVRRVSPSRRPISAFVSPFPTSPITSRSRPESTPSATRLLARWTPAARSELGAAAGEQRLVVGLRRLPPRRQEHLDRPISFACPPPGLTGGPRTAELTTGVPAAPTLRSERERRRRLRPALGVEVGDTFQLGPDTREKELLGVDRGRGRIAPELAQRPGVRHADEGRDLGGEQLERPLGGGSASAGRPAQSSTSARAQSA